MWASELHRYEVSVTKCLRMPLIEMAKLQSSLAYAEVRLILARMIWNFDIQLAADSHDWMGKQNSYLMWEQPPLNVHLLPKGSLEKRTTFER